MAVGERPTQKQRRKTPSFSSSLLDAIYHSIDEQQPPQVEDYDILQRRINGPQVEEEIESLRRAIMIEKWMENTTTTRHLPSNSDSSTDSSMFSSSEPESSALRSTKRSSSSSLFPNQKPKHDQTTPQNQGRFTRTKSRAMKIYGDLKKVKEPISPGGKIANFLNSIFSPRNNLKKNLEEWSSVRKSRSMKDNATSASRSCLSKNPPGNNNNNTNNNKSKRSVRFCPVSVILDEDNRPCGHKRLYEDEYSSIGSQFIKKNIDSFRLFEGKKKKNVIRKHGLMRELFDNESDVDDKSCASSDLFELENIGGAYEQELPVYGTTSIKMNQAIARGYLM